MKILLVSERDELHEFIKRNFIPRGAEIIQYYNPIKAMDNLDEVDPEILEAFSKLGIPLEEQKQMTGVAVDAVLDSG